MPQLNEIVRGREIGKGGTASWQKFIWSACLDCGIERWVLFLKGKADHSRCHACANKPKGHNRWQQHTLNENGYTYVKIASDDFFYPMCKCKVSSGVVKEHRLVMAKHLGRCLNTWEFVHHKNGNKRDNRIENLELTTNGAHTIAHNKGYKDGYLKGYYDGKDKRIKELEAENILLKSQKEFKVA